MLTSIYDKFRNEHYLLADPPSSGGASTFSSKTSDSAAIGVVSAGVVDVGSWDNLKKTKQINNINTL